MNAQEPEQMERRLADMETRLRQAEARAREARIYAIGAAFLAILFRYHAKGVLWGLIVLAAIAVGRWWSRSTTSASGEDNP